MATSINAREELALAPIGRFHITFAILVGFIMFFDGFDLFNAAYVIPLVRKSWQPSPAMIGVMLSSGIVGLSIGSVVQGLLSDRFGRRRVMLLALWLLTAASGALATVAHTPLAFALLRLVLGTALGMVTPLALTCINEWAPRKHANTYATWVFQFGFSAGGIFAGVAGILLTPRFGWQSLYYIGILSAVVAAVATIWLPESIQYLLIRRRFDEARQLLSRLRPERSELYRDAVLATAVKATRVGSIADLVGPLYRRNTIVHWITGFLSLFCIHGLTGWLPSLVVNRGEGVTSAFAYGTLVMIASVAGGISMGWLADKLQSRIRVMVVGYIATAASMGAVAFSLWQAPALVAVAVASTGFFMFGSQAVLNNYQAMCYRTEVRGTGIGIAIGLNRVGGILGPFIVGLVVSINPDPSYTFGVFCAAAALSALVIALGRTEITATRSSDIASADSSAPSVSTMPGSAQPNGSK
ncbi:MFS transporter [Paraburkholderia kururiensis]|uniref:MFS transporter n=1 Tax=Paraburkholderia kururiensis TaxID=984307 RepID=UPI0018F51A27|nr:MFS transporter [Paraburkholderia kururiensis]